MLMEIQDILKILGLLGFGGIAGAYFQSKFEYLRQKNEDIHELKRKRYDAIIIKMLTLIDKPKGLEKLKLFRPDLKSYDDLRDEIKVELLNSILFSSDSVILSIGEFIQNPTWETYMDVVVQMRKDLWGKRTKIKSSSLYQLGFE